MPAQNLAYLFAAFAVTWLGISFYMWTLRQSVRRLTEELDGLPKTLGS